MCVWFPIPYKYVQNVSLAHSLSLICWMRCAHAVCVCVCDCTICIIICRYIYGSFVRCINCFTPKSIIYELNHTLIFAGIFGKALKNDFMLPTLCSFVSLSHAPMNKNWMIFLISIWRNGKSIICLLLLIPLPDRPETCKVLDSKKLKCAKIPSPTKTHWLTFSFLFYFQHSAFIKTYFFIRNSVFKEDDFFHWVFKKNSFDLQNR